MTSSELAFRRTAALPRLSLTTIALGLLLPVACSGSTANRSDDGTGGSIATGGSASGGSPSTGGTGGGTSGGGGASTTGGATNGSGGSAGARSACKRGIAYGHHSKADLTALSPSIAFWYNWTHVEDAAWRDGAYHDLNIEYIPMVWGGDFSPTTFIAEIPAHAKTLLGFNEPNFGWQSNMSALEAASKWPEVEKIADARGLTLVSPAVNFCGGNCNETDPFQYLDDFFAACPGCRVDKVAFHIYVDCNATGGNKAQWLINHVETYKSRFAQPLWLTEFACDNAKTEGEQIAFLKDAVAYLENEPRLERYAWFSGRFPDMAYVNLLGADGVLTALGEAYVDAPKAPNCN